MKREAFLFLLLAALMAVMGSLTFDAVSASNDPALALSVFAVAGGTFAWTLTFRFGAANRKQRGIALALTVIDLIGFAVLFVGATLGVGATLIAVNVFAVFAFHIVIAQTQKTA